MTKLNPIPGYDSPAFAVSCPKCSAKPGEWCRDRPPGHEESPHRARLIASGIDPDAPLPAA